MDEQVELIVAYDPGDRERYESRDLSSLFHQDGYPVELWHGIYKRGRFPEVAVRAGLKALGFTVLISDPGMPNGGGYILTHYAGKRRKRDPAFTRMFQWFPEELICRLNRECDLVKGAVSSNTGGGDPDLFVSDAAGDRFFVEVKDHDELLPKQKATFHKISEILVCDVLIARVVPEPGAKPGDQLQLIRPPANKALHPTPAGAVMRRRG
ncbi:MAG TPA: hypothetical protein VGK32_04135 [Vicinamibacterales bacterium]|jgi:hypothetical protein